MVIGQFVCPQDGNILLLFLHFFSLHNVVAVIKPLFCFLVSFLPPVSDDELPQLQEAAWLARCLHPPPKKHASFLLTPGCLMLLQLLCEV